MADSSNDTRPKSTQPSHGPGGKCPQCGKPRSQQYRPFCSARCRDLDLGKWFDGSYAIPAVEADEEFPEDRDDQIG